MNDKQHPSILIWLMNSLDYGTATEFVELQEIKERYSGEASGISVGNFFNKYIKNVKIKNERCNDNWAKITKPYYGIKWKMVTNTVSDLQHFPCKSLRFFVLSKSSNALHYENSVMW